MLGFLTDEVKITRVLDAVAAGVTDQNGTGVDMTGFDGVVFMAAFGTLTAGQVTKLKVQQSDDDGSVDDYTDLADTASTALADGDSNNDILLDIQHPRKRYVRPVVDRGTQNAVINGVWALQYKARGVPVTQPASVAFLEQHNNKAEGTA